MDLPNELLCYFLDYLDSEMLIIIRHVSQDWLQACSYVLRRRKVKYDKDEVKAIYKIMTKPNYLNRSSSYNHVAEIDSARLFNFLYKNKVPLNLNDFIDRVVNYSEERLGWSSLGYAHNGFEDSKICDVLFSIYGYEYTYNALLYALRDDKELKKFKKFVSSQRIFIFERMIEEIIDEMISSALEMTRVHINRKPIRNIFIQEVYRKSVKRSRIHNLQWLVDQGYELGEKDNKIFLKSFIN